MRTGGLGNMGACRTGESQPTPRRHHETLPSLVPEKKAWSFDHSAGSSKDHLPVSYKMLPAKSYPEQPLALSGLGRFQVELLRGRQFCVGHAADGRAKGNL